jgi:hypothetical protein
MNRLRSRTIRYVIASILAMSMLPWLSGAWGDALRGSDTDARAAWLYDRVDTWPSEADRTAFRRALAETDAHAWTTAEQFTARVLKAYEAHAPGGRTAADLLGHHPGADAATLAHWLHHQDSQWGSTAPVPRMQSAALAALASVRAALGSATVPPRTTVPARWVDATEVRVTAPAERWLIRRLVQATPRAP